MSGKLIQSFVDQGVVDQAGTNDSYHGCFSESYFFIGAALFAASNGENYFVPIVVPPLATSSTTDVVNTNTDEVSEKSSAATSSSIQSNSESLGLFAEADELSMMLCQSVENGTDWRGVASNFS